MEAIFEESPATNFVLKMTFAGETAGVPLVECGMAARNLLSAVNQNKGLRGLDLAIKIVRGGKDRRISEQSMNSSLYGIDSGVSLAYHKSLADLLLRRGYVKEVHREKVIRGGAKVAYLGVEVTQEGYDVLGTPQQPFLLPVQAELLVTSVLKGGSPLVEGICRLRSRVAFENGVTPHNVLSNLAIRQVVKALPKSLHDLECLPAIAPTQRGVVGEALCKLVDQHCLANNLTGGGFKLTKDVVTEEMAKCRLTESEVRTLSVLLLNNCSIDDAAGVTGKERSTIFKHLHNALEKGYLWTPLTVTDLLVSGVVAVTVEALTSSTIQSRVTHLRPVMTAIEEQQQQQISFSTLDLAVAMLKGEHGVDPDGKLKWGTEEQSVYRKVHLFSADEEENI